MLLVVFRIQKTTFIYALNDPRTGEIRYVGKADKPLTRRQIHLQHAHKSRTHKNAWILELRKHELAPVLEVLDEVPADCWQDFERSYILVFRAIGVRLTNGLDGGEGFSGGDRHPRPQLGKKLDREIVNRQAKGRVGLKRSLETRRKIATALIGNTNGRFRNVRARSLGGDSTPLLPFDP